MATTTLYLSLGSKRLSGTRNVQPATSGSNDIAITVNLATVTSKGDFLTLCKEAMLLLPHTVT